MTFIRQAIVTKFLGPTNFRGSRVKATAAAGSVTLGWNHALNSDQNHHAAAQALATKYKWNGEWIGGGMPDNSGHCYVLANSESFTVNPAAYEIHHDHLGWYIVGENEERDESGFDPNGVSLGFDGRPHYETKDEANGIAKRVYCR